MFLLGALKKIVLKSSSHLYAALVLFALADLHGLVTLFWFFEAYMFLLGAFKKIVLKSGYLYVVCGLWLAALVLFAMANLRVVVICFGSSMTCKL